MIKKIKLMADYGCYPLWYVDSIEMGDIDPASLPLSPITIQRLLNWAAEYDKSLNWDDPSSSEWPEEDAKQFTKEGHELWHLIQSELGPEYQVLFLLG